jgi:hypothetical protein
MHLVIQLYFHALPDCPFIHWLMELQACLTLWELLVDPPPRIILERPLAMPGIVFALALTSSVGGILLILVVWHLYLIGTAQVMHPHGHMIQTMTSPRKVLILRWVGLAWVGLAWVGLAWLGLCLILGWM